MSVIPKELMRKKLKRDLKYWAAMWLLPIFVSVMSLMSYYASTTTMTNEMVRAVGVMLFISYVMVACCSLMMMPVIFLEWFPSEYYEDLTICPICGKEEVKCINDCKCLECGATKDDMDKARADQTRK